MAQNAASSESDKVAATVQGAAHNTNAASQAAVSIQEVVNASNNSALFAALRSLQRVLQTILGLT